MKLLTGFIKDEDGATMVEYCLMASLIAIVCISAVTILGQNTKALYTSAGNSM